MKYEAKHIVETAAVLAVGNAAVWTLQDVSLIVSITLGILSCGWVMTQWAKFLLRWAREEAARMEKRKPTDYGDLDK